MKKRPSCSPCNGSSVASKSKMISFGPLGGFQEDPTSRRSTLRDPARSFVTLFRLAVSLVSSNRFRCSFRLRLGYWIRLLDHTANRDRSAILVVVQIFVAQPDHSSLATNLHRIFDQIRISIIGEAAGNCADPDALLDLPQTDTAVSADRSTIDCARISSRLGEKSETTGYTCGHKAVAPSCRFLSRQRVMPEATAFSFIVKIS